jgi:hypothetical protein
MKIRLPGLGAAAAALSLILGCGSSAVQDGGPDGGPDGGQDNCTPSDGGYCGVCHFMTACGEYPPGPYGMQTGLVLPPCFQDVGFWNPVGVWLNDGGNPVTMQNVPFFQNLYCSSFQGQRYALVQVGTTTDRHSADQASYWARCTNGRDGYWLRSGGQVLQIIESVAGGFPANSSDLVSWASSNGTNYSLAADTGQVLQPLMDLTHGGFPETYIVDLKTMQIRTSRSYGADSAQIFIDFGQYLDGGIQ